MTREQSKRQKKKMIRLQRSESCPVCHHMCGQQTSSTLLPPPPPPSQPIITTFIHGSSGLWMRLVRLRTVVFCFVASCVSE